MTKPWLVGEATSELGGRARRHIDEPSLSIHFIRKNENFACATLHIHICSGFMTFGIEREELVNRKLVLLTYQLYDFG